MSGILYGIGAAFFWSINNIIDKHLTNKHAADGNVWAIVILSSLFSATLLPISYSLGSVNMIVDRHTFVLMFCGSLMVCWLYFYLKSLAEADTSVVMTLLVLAPFFALLFSYIILGEKLSSWQLFGGGILVFSSLLVSYDQKSNTLNKKLLLTAMLASTTMGLMHTLFKLETSPGEFWTNMFWRSVGMSTTGLLLCVCFKSITNRFYIYLTQYLKRGVFISATNETLTVFGDLFFSFALLLAPVALIQTTEAYQPIFIIVISFFLVRLGYSSFGQQDTGGVVQKIVSIVLVLIGSTVLVLNS